MEFQSYELHVIHSLYADNHPVTTFKSTVARDGDEYAFEA